MAADDGRGSQRGARESASSRNSNTNNSARGDARGAANTDGRGSQREARESAASSRSQAGAGGGVSRTGNTNNGQSGARESRPGADGRGSQREARASAASTGRVGGGLAGAAGLGGQSIGGNVTSTYQGRPASVASAALSRQSLAPDRAMPTGPVSGNMPASVTPSFRQSENLSMSKLANMRAPSFRATEESAMAKENAWQDTLATIRAPEAGTTNPYNRIVQGQKTPSYGNLTNMTIAEVRAFQKAMKASGLYPSTAVGAYQMISGTLDEAVKRTGLPETTKFTKATQDYLARDLVSNRAKQVAAQDGTVSPTSLANQMAKEWASFKQQNGVGAYDDDGVNNASVSATAVRGIAGGLVGSGAIGSAAPTQTRNIGRQVADRPRKASNGGFPDTPADAPTPTAKPSESERFSKTYLGGPQAGANLSTRAPMTGTTGFTSMVAGRPAGPISQNPNAGYTPRAADPSLMSDAEQAATFGEQPGGAPVAPREIRPTSPSPTTVDPAYSVRPVSPTPNSPEIAPTVPSTPVPAVKATPVAPSEETTVKVPLTTGQKIAAGAVDIGLGLVPGVGIAASIYNGLATLTGQPTIGGMTVDLLGGGSNLGQQGVSTRGEGGVRADIRPGSDPYREGLRKQGFYFAGDDVKDGKDVSISDVPETPGKRFRERYLIPTIKRPTPAEKWGRRRRA